MQPDWMDIPKCRPGVASTVCPSVSTCARVLIPLQYFAGDMVSFFTFSTLI